MAQLEAQVQGDQAAIDNARTMLSYTRIVAPIDGRIGLRLVDEGNYVQAGDATGIVTITQVQADLGAVQPAAAAVLAGEQGLRERHGSTSTRWRSTARHSVDRGKLQVIDNQMDQTTGTIRMKAEFPNAELQLWPGQFVNIRLLVETLKQVVTVPTAAVQRGPNGTFVYVVDAESKVAVRPITVAQQDDARAVISDGVKAQEQVVTTGFTRLSNGTRVRVQAGEGETQPDAAPSARRRPREGAPTEAPAQARGPVRAQARRTPTASSGASAPRPRPATPSAKQ